jgi:hypothetical protein
MSLSCQGSKNNREFDGLDIYDFCDSWSVEICDVGGGRLFEGLLGDFLVNEGGVAGVEEESEDVGEGG